MKDKRSLVELAKIIFPRYCSLPSSRVHYELARLLTETDDNIIIALPREFGKSTYAWLFFPAWNILTGKYQFLVYIASNKDRAEEQFQSFRYEIQSHPILKEVAKVIIDKMDTLEYEDRLNNRRHLIKVYGAGQNVRGLRYMEKRPDIIILDDIENLEEVQSQKQRQRLKEWFFGEILPLSKEGRFFIIGTILHEDSLLNTLLEEPPQNFKAIKYGILDEKGNSIWPEKYPLEKIEIQKEDYRKKGLLHLWYMEYMNEPISSETQIFKREYFKYYRPEDLKWRENGFSVFTTVDLAISEAQTADYTAVVTVAVSPQNHWFILDIDYGRYNPSETIEAIFRAVVKYHPLKVGIEKVAYQQALAHFLEKEMVKRNQFFEIVPLIAQKAKELRIQSLQPRFVAGTIWFPINAAFLTELESELLMFPRGKYDDLIDTLAYMEQIATPPVGFITQDIELPSISAF
ncbi:MAG: hypothetical protein DRP34_00560 [Thermodesulfobacteriota bacterium]|nr:MAG: hypothetical protein DRP34_00560 [Thermodesulfobacteriota bacterium]